MSTRMNGNCLVPEPTDITCAKRASVSAIRGTGRGKLCGHWHLQRMSKAVEELRHTSVLISLRLVKGSHTHDGWVPKKGKR